MVENPEEELWEPMEYFHVRMETFDELENVNEEWMEVKQRVRDFFETHSYTEALEEYKSPAITMKSGMNIFLFILHTGILCVHGMTEMFWQKHSSQLWDF